MKFVVIGGTGLIGSKTVKRLREKGHEAIAASPDTGVNTITGEGLTDALTDADVVIDLANSPSFDVEAVVDFFETSGRNLLSAEKAAGVKHHIALSVVGTDRLSDKGYFRGKSAQESLIRQSGIPYTIVHSTQFFEFLGAIANSAAQGQSVRLPSAYIQPIASEDVADAVASVALSEPANGIVEIAGRDRLPLNEGVGRFLEAKRDPREVILDEEASYFGVKLEDKTALVPGAGARIGATRFEDWLNGL